MGGSADLESVFKCHFILVFPILNNNMHISFLFFLGEWIHRRYIVHTDGQLGEGEQEQLCDGPLCLAGRNGHYREGVYPTYRSLNYHHLCVICVDMIVPNKWSWQGCALKAICKAKFHYVSHSSSYSNQLNNSIFCLSIFPSVNVSSPHHGFMCHCGWGLGAFLRWWPPSTMWVDPLIYLWPPPGMSE